jgi:hypothetical protein
VDKMKGVPAQRPFGIGLILLIAALFTLHGCFIKMQDRHYKDFDSLLAKAIDKEPKPRRYAVGTGSLYAGVHWMVAAFAYVAAVYFLCSGSNF